MYAQKLKLVHVRDISRQYKQTFEHNFQSSCSQDTIIRELFTVRHACTHTLSTALLTTRNYFLGIIVQWLQHNALLIGVYAVYEIDQMLELAIWTNRAETHLFIHVIHPHKEFASACAKRSQ
jgi:hypothetical protein